MTEKEVLSYFKKPCDEGFVDEVYIYLRNDRRIWNSMVKSLVEFAHRKINNKTFNKILFIQAVKLEIDKWLLSSYFKSEYGQYLSRKVDTVTRYYVARQIASSILYDWFRIKL